MFLHCKASFFPPKFSSHRCGTVVRRPQWFSNKQHNSSKSLFSLSQRDTCSKWKIGCQIEGEENENEMYPFDDNSYKRVYLAFVVQNENEDKSSSNTGSLVLMERELSESLQVDIMAGDVRGLPIQVGGDILVGISYAAAGKSPERPLTSDLLFKFLKKYLGECGEDEQLLMVAITNFKNETYFGRLFIDYDHRLIEGDSELKQVHQDIDCRPSDGIWLAIKEMPDHKPINPLTSILPGDLEVIQRLKREMAVALAEEDYTTAARLRDHPYMLKYKAIVECMEDGRMLDAETMKEELEKEVRENEDSGNWENDDFL